MAKILSTTMILILAMLIWYNQHYYAQTSLPSINHPSSPNRVKIIAEGSSAVLYPENTTLAIGNAIANGVDFVQIDVRSTHDSHLVLMRSDDLSSTTNGQGLVSQKSYTAISSLDAAFHFTQDNILYPYRGQGIIIPLLQTIIENFPQTLFYIRLHDDSDQAANDLIKLLIQDAKPQRFVVSCERQAQCILISQRSPQIQLARDFRGDNATSLALSMGWLPVFIDKESILILSYYSWISEAVIRQAQDMGRRVWLSIPRRFSKADKLALAEALSLDGLMLSD